MTDIVDDGRAGEPRRAARGPGPTPAGALVALVLASVPPSLHADADGRADWRPPLRATPEASTSSEPPQPSLELTEPSAPSAPPERSEPPEPPEPTEPPEPPEPTDPVATPARNPPAGNAAPVLGGIAPQRLLAGRRWRLHLRARDVDGEPPRVLVRGLPPGARLTDEGAGWHVVDWTPPATSDGTLDLTIVAVDALDSRLRSERVVRLELVPDAARAPDLPTSGEPGRPPDASPLDESGADGVDPSPADPTGPGADRSGAGEFDPGRLDGGELDPGELGPDEVGPGELEPDELGPDVPRLAPRIEPLAAQIVSAGRTVAFRVDADLPNERVPLLQIDRLPRNASFDRNADGSRTFHWPTGDTDQGEHRFRISALHPDDETLVSRVDLLVVVGDPSRALTVPLGEGTWERRGDASPFADGDGEVTDGPIADPDDPRARPSPDGASEGDAFDGGAPTGDDEPFLPQGGDVGLEYFDPEFQGATDLPPGFEGDLPPDYLEEGLESGTLPEGDYFEPPGPDYGADDLPLGPDGLPFDP